MPIQVINSRKLSARENFWLKDLHNSLEPLDVQQVINGIYKQGKAARTRAYLDAITRANKDSLQEAIRMSSTALTLDEIFEEAGLVAKWEARGEVKGRQSEAINIAQKMVNLGYPLEDIASVTQLDIEKIKSLYKDTIYKKEGAASE